MDTRTKKNVDQSINFAYPDLSPEVVSLLYQYADPNMERFQSALTPLVIHDIEQGHLQQFELQYPYAITFEICNATNRLLTMYQISPGNYNSVSYPPDIPIISTDRPLHQHDFVEIMLVLSGSVKNHIQERTYVYQAGQCCVMNRNIQHCEEYSSDFQAVFFMLSQELLNQYVTWNIRYDGYTRQPASTTPLDELLVSEPAFEKTYLDYSPLVSTDEILQSTSEILNHLILDTASQKPGFLFQIGLYLQKLFAVLNDPMLFNCQQMHLDLSGQEFLCMKIDQLFASRHGRVSRAELEGIFGYNSDYLNRVIKQTTGMTLNEYGRQFCLKEAHRQLMETDKNISQIISDLGFSNHTYFYRIFKEMYGITPGEVRT